MQLKNIQLSFVILLSLIVLSFAFYVSAENNSATSNNIFADSDQDGLSDQEEKLYGTDPRDKDTDKDSYTDGVEVASGYDPLKPAPGDKIVPENASAQTNNSKENLTKKLAYQITQVTQDKTGKNPEINLEDIQSLVGQTLSQDQSSSLIGENTSKEPLFSINEIKTKKQNYGGLSDKKAQEKRKADFVEYANAVIYIFSSNSPQAITSGSLDISTIINSMSQKIISAFSLRDPNQIGDISESGKKILEQMKEITVPEELVDLHIQGLTFATYAEDMQKYISPNSLDPIADIQNLAQINGLVFNAASFIGSIKAKLDEYGFAGNNDLINSALEKYQENEVGN